MVSLKEDEILDSLAHAQYVMQASTLARKERVDDKKRFLVGMMASSSKAIKKWLGRIGQTGAWLMQMPLKLNGTILSKDEFFS